MSIRQQLSEERKRLQKEGCLPEWFTTQGWIMFKGKYLNKGEEAFRGRAKTIAKTAASYLPDQFDNRSRKQWENLFYRNIWNGWTSCSTPVLSNTGTDKGMSVSCSGVYIGDSVDSFYKKLHENAILSKHGFGTSAFLGDIRGRGEIISRGGKASGTFPVFQDQNIMASKISQGGTRRGSVATYIPVMHPDFYEIYNEVYNSPDEVNVGFCWYDKDTENMDNGDEETIARFKKLMKLCCVQGKGYLVFPDKVNRNRPQMYKDHRLDVKMSNLCSEIFLYCDEDHTFTCVLAAMNLAKYDEWKDTDAIYVTTVFLDCIAEDFIQRGKGISGLECAVRFTEKGRALGLGVCGFHTYLQEKMIPFESFEAHKFNGKFFKELHDKSLEASKTMAKELGEPEWCKGYGVRNTHRTAMMPTMSTAAIMGGVSQGIEPMYGNCFIAELASGDELRINPVFLELMKERGKYDKKTIDSIVYDKGSVRNQNWLSDHEKLVFRTFFEINQENIINQAAARQRWICQGQSLNLGFSSDEDGKYIAYIHKLLIKNPWVFGRYYVRSQTGIEASKGCISCQ